MRRSPTLQKILIANRGEISRRIQRTTHRMGLRSVAVFSDADADMPFVREADEALRIGPAPSLESYLRVEAILEAAHRTGADAIHPGYGFLAENAEFAEAVEAQGLVFLGPSPEVIRAMGSKMRAKEIVASVGVPIVPGYHGDEQSDEALREAALEIGFPLLIKASAGGGGKGMKLVRAEPALGAAIASARREALAAFADDRLLIERYIERPRHIEVQILGDSHGTILHVYERECSIQRRHQKIVEETPSPALDEAMRESILEAAVRCGEVLGYRSAGTVEMILAPSLEFYFLEVNTRLQVEHPVTEMVTALDLVEEQIRIGRGERLRHRQDTIPRSGHAIEVRLYAEDPANGFLPQTGRILDWHLPAAPGLRIDSGVETGSEVGIHYDPMLAKVIAHAPDRPTAIDALRRALCTLSVQGLLTNRDFLIRLLGHEAFRAGELDTHFIERHLQAALDPPPAPEFVRRAALAAMLAGFEARRRASEHVPGVERGFRLNRWEDAWVEFEDGSDAGLRIEYRHLGRSRFECRLGPARGGLPFDPEQRPEPVSLSLVEASEPELCFEEGGVRRRARVIVDGWMAHVHMLEASISLRERSRFPEGVVEERAGGCVAPMPGRILSLRVEQGQMVEAGALLLVMEAMKMEHEVTAPQAGRVAELRVAVGDQVEAAALLAVIEPGA
ncbi:MAG: ATP-grasp domain-containing protein [Myxococcales bacterium]|nr:ATP-grasp domain-containing protein [Myxococcales bacterium]